mgnify:FL=1
MNTMLKVLVKLHFPLVSCPLLVNLLYFSAPKSAFVMSLFCLELALEAVTNPLVD